MSNLIDKSALVAEIEKRIKELQDLFKEGEKKLDSFQKTAILLCIDECKVVLNILDTIEVKEVQEEPVSEDLEEEINKVAVELFDKLLPQDGDFITEVSFSECVETIARHFANWQKEQMMKDAVYGLVCGHDESSPAWIDLNLLNKPNIKVGTEVKLIIIKDE